MNNEECKDLYQEIEELEHRIAVQQEEITQLKNENERLRDILPPGADRSEGVREGTWAVFAEKVVRERDEAQAEIERLLREDEERSIEMDQLRAGCRELEEENKRLKKWINQQSKDSPTDISEEIAVYGSTVRDALLLINIAVPYSKIEKWGNATKKEVISWAVAVHLAASDNNVKIPPKPEILDQVVRIEELREKLNNLPQPQFFKPCPYCKDLVAEGMRCHCGWKCPDGKTMRR